MSEEVNRKCHPIDMMVQLSTPYTDPECHNALRRRWTDDCIATVAGDSVCNSTIG